VIDDNKVRSGCLYVVATPIGNLADLGGRAIGILANVDRIVAEDTRHSGKLLQHYAIQTPMNSLHEHNERTVAPALVEQMQAGLSVALISDAGTPLISDPGFNLVRLARESGVPVVPVPGPSAVICALSASGLPTDRFVFEGFLPARPTARRARLEWLQQEPRTLVFYETGHRIVESFADMATILGAQRPAVLARELTKQFETILDGSLGELATVVQQDSNQQKGEMVVLVHGVGRERGDVISPEDEQVLKTLLQELPVRQAAKLTARITGGNRRQLYDRALALRNAIHPKGDRM
jgi:16S rRNA (cytidine1402-2'-O)-methyltransferase